MQGKIELARGAEAIIYSEEGRIVKQRFKKGYRISEIDDELRRQRTKKEAALLQKSPVPTPRLISSDNKDTIVMEKIEGQKLRDVLDSKPELSYRVGEHVAELHNSNIIHADLTTSNMILDGSGEVVLIDFGLSFHSTKIEDKAVDLHLFKQALESKHYKVYERALKEFLKGYSKANDYDKVLERLRMVEKRGRYRKG